MRKGFNFEANLPHQKAAVNSLLHVFEDTQIEQNVREYQNNLIRFNDATLKRNIRDIQDLNELENMYSEEKIFDIHMETGTGKTYTYTKSIFELNKNLGVFKFIIAVPTLAIKAGTINFLKSQATKEHFRGLYNKEIKLNIMDSKENKSKKKTIPQSISDFVKNTNMSSNIQVLIINTGMINSTTIKTKFDRNLLDKYNVPLEGIKACNPITIIDEPHKFPDSGKTFNNILEFNSQFIIRYGATFKDKKNEHTYKNLLYSLNAIKSFNQDLVKGITTNVLTFKDAEDCDIKFKDSDGISATFELNNSGHKKIYNLTKDEKLDMIHNQITNLGIEKLNKTTVVLDNGLEMKKGDKINPYSYSLTTQEHMIRETIKKHFKLEKDLLTREVKIKPLTLFFIDNIESYRNDDNSNGEMAKLVEEIIIQEVENLLKTEKNNFYIEYLEKTLSDISSVHGGYFSKDNTGKDDKVEKEINEILYDKEALLDLENPRRFIFSKWTLKEGWDNPNVFQICKLRSSGSETSKLQEVGRGLRIPVNQYMERVKDEQFQLNYFVDFTERDFVNKLKNEINSETTFKVNELRLEDNLIKKLVADYKFDDDNALLGKLFELNIIEFNHNFKEGGFEKLKKEFSLSNDELKAGKIKNKDEKSQYVKIRKDNYNKLKDLWEEINKKVILEYDFKNESEVEELFVNCLKKKNLYENKLVLTTHNLNKKTGDFILRENLSVNKTTVSNLKYSEFLLELSKKINININTLHNSFKRLAQNKFFDINDYLNYETIRIIRNMFKIYLIEEAQNNLKIKSNEVSNKIHLPNLTFKYNEVSNKIHPTALTNKNGEVKDKIKAGNVGVDYSGNGVVVDNYLFDQLYFDSELERKNIIEEIEDVVVFTKIPKNSVRIPIIGGGTYSPDFAYVVQFKEGKKELNFVVETKNKEINDLSAEENMKIHSAEILFSSEFFDVKFKTQLKNEKIISLIQEIRE